MGARRAVPSPHPEPQLRLVPPPGNRARALPEHRLAPRLQRLRALDTHPTLQVRQARRQEAVRHRLRVPVPPDRLCAHDGGRPLGVREAAEEAAEDEEGDEREAGWDGSGYSVDLQ